MERQNKTSEFHRKTQIDNISHNCVTLIIYDYYFKTCYKMKIV